MILQSVNFLSSWSGHDVVVLVCGVNALLC
jgi:hypothetical protein